jgi:hypothetical protein
MASSQGTQLSKMNKREATLVFTEVYRSLPELWDTGNRYYSNRVKKAAAYGTIVTHTRRHTELTKKLTNLMGNLCCARDHSVQFLMQFFTQLNCTV